MERGKQFIPYEQALTIKELGFDEECFTVYKNQSRAVSFLSKIMSDDVYWKKNSMLNINYLSAPSYQQVFKWFREEHKLDSYIKPYFDNYEYYIADSSSKFNNEFNNDESSYERAELACLKKMIEIVYERKEKNK